MRGLVFAILIGSLLPRISAGGQLTEWGVNGHPLSQAAYYDVPIDEQLDLVSELGARWYRVDLEAGSFRAQTARFDELVADASARGIRVLPVLLSSPGCQDPSATPARIREAAYEFASTVASRYKGRITHWELGNEFDAVAMIRKGETTRGGTEWKWDAPDGSSADDYAQDRYEKARAEIEGLCEGVKAADGRAQTIVDTAGWLHTGFIDRLVREDHVPFDILAWHWYSEMGDMTRVQGQTDLVAALRAYGKPLWITETSRRGGSSGGTERELSDYARTSIALLGRNPRIGGVFVYELLDEPYLADTPAYGLVAVARDAGNRWTVARKKEAFDSLRATIDGTP
jgi:hypothetical protein